MEANKVLALFSALVLLLVLGLALTSGYAYPADNYYSSYKSYYFDPNGYSPYYKEKVIEKTVVEPYYSGRVSTEKKVVIEQRGYPKGNFHIYPSKDYDPCRLSCYQTSGQRDYYDYDYHGYPSSNYRYQPVYRYADYGKDEYTKDYYYEPRYDWHLGYYNWKY